MNTLGIGIGLRFGAILAEPGAPVAPDLTLTMTDGTPLTMTDGTDLEFTGGN